ncbi:MAG: hypothetical protein RL701_7908, partial [Pseudomonadota bacterium]
MDAGSRLLQNAVPLFLLLILVEMYVDHRRGTQRYRLAATWSDLATGTVAQVCDLLLKAAFLPVYVWVYEHARVFELAPLPWLHWAAALLGVDLLYYFWHRAGHEVRALWSVHSVHHQSEDMNLAVALRQPALQAPSVVLFFLPLAVLGVSPVVLMLAYSCNLIYQFFVHTEAVRSLGVLEWVFNSPSHHRVHHGCNPQYLDKNYGGVLIVWDRLLGTFAPEREAPRYGVTTPLASYNPVWANWAEFALLFRQTRAQTSLRGALALWFGHPANTLPAATKPATNAPAKYEPSAPKVAPYVRWQAVLLFLGLNSAFLAVAQAVPHSPLAAAWAGGAVLWSAASLLGWFEQRPWVRAYEP